MFLLSVDPNSRQYRCQLAAASLKRGIRDFADFGRAAYRQPLRAAVGGPRRTRDWYQPESGVIVVPWPEEFIQPPPSAIPVCVTCDGVELRPEPKKRTSAGFTFPQLTRFASPTSPDIW